MPSYPRRTYRRRKPATYRKKSATYRKKSATYRRKYTKRKGVYNQQLKIQKNRFAGWPEVLYTKLTYFENNYKFSLGNLDKLNRYSFRMNSPYDPVMASYNKSANYFDDYMTHYKFCRTMGAKITVKFANDVTNTRQMQFALIPNAQNYSYKDMDEIATQIRKRISSWTNSTATVKTLQMYLPVHTIFGISKQQYLSQLPGNEFDITNMGLGSYTDLSTPAQLDLWYAKIDESGTFECQALGTVKITFYCKFYIKYPSKPLGIDIGDTTIDDGETITPGDTIFDPETILGPDEPTFPNP